MESNTSLYNVYKDIHTNHITSIEKLKNSHPDLYKQLMHSIYEYLISDKVSNAIYQSCSAYYGKVGKAETVSIIQADSMDEKAKHKKQISTKIGLKHGDLVHDYFIYLLTEVKKKGKTKDREFFSIIFSNENLESWIPITLSSFKNWIHDRRKTTHPTNSLDAPIDPASSDNECSLGAMISDSHTKTPDSIYESKVASYDILNSLADESLSKHPEYFIALDWFLFSSNNGMFKPTELYNHFSEILMTKSSIPEAAQFIFSDALDDLSSLGLDKSKINYSIDLHRICELLENIKVVNFYRSNAHLSTFVNNNDRESCLKLASEKEKKTIAALSHWLERAKRSFQINSTVIQYK